MIQIKVLREKKKITQDQMAEKLGIGRTAVSMWESGESKPRADKLPELARILGCTIDDLFQEEVN